MFPSSVRDSGFSNMIYCTGIMSVIKNTPASRFGCVCFIIIIMIYPPPSSVKKLLQLHFFWQFSKARNKDSIVFVRGSHKPKVTSCDDDVDDDVIDNNS